MDMTHRIDADVSLRLVEPRHAQELYTLIDFNREHLRPWFRWPPQVKTADEVREAIGNWLRMFADAGAFVAIIDVGGKASGLIYGLEPQPENRRMEIGYWLDRGVEGRGIMMRAARAMVSHAFNALQMNRVTIKMDIHNARSQAVARRLGFTHEGTLRMWFPYPDGRVADMHVYGMVREDWPHREQVSLQHRIDDELTLVPRESQYVEEAFRVIDANREHLARWLPWVHKTRSVDDTRTAARQHLRELAEGRTLALWILDRGRLIGSVSLDSIWNERRDADRMCGASADIGYWLAADAQGNGAMTRCVQAMVDHAFGSLKLQRVTIRAEPQNARSCAVPRRLGFACEATLRWICEYDGRHVDHHVFAQLAHGWRSSTSASSAGRTS